MPPVESAKLNLVGESRSVGLARRFVSDALCSWGMSALVDSARLVVSELVTNAVLHAQSDVLVQVLLDGGKVRLEVSDESSDTPARRHYGTDATTGRGLGLVAAASTSWGTTVGEIGKTVWAELVSGDEGAPRRGSSAVRGIGSSHRGGEGRMSAGGGEAWGPPRGLLQMWRVA